MKRIALLLAATAAIGSAPVHAQTNVAAAPKLVPSRDGVEVQVGTKATRITAITDGLIRVRVAKNGLFPEDASWAVPAEIRRQKIAVTAAPDGFTTASVRVRVGEGGAITFETLDGKIISADAAPVATDGKAFAIA